MSQQRRSLARRTLSSCSEKKNHLWPWSTGFIRIRARYVGAATVVALRNPESFAYRIVMRTVTCAGGMACNFIGTRIKTVNP